MFFLRVDESAQVQGGGSVKITREQVDSSDTAAKIEADVDMAVFIVCLRFLFFQHFLSQFACVKYQKETIILQRQKKKYNQENNNKTVLSQKEEKKNGRKHRI